MSKIKLPKYGDPLSAGVNMAQRGLENEVGIRNEHDDDADLFASLGALAGPKPRGAAALFSGIAKGLEYGAKSKSTAKKQESLDKYNRVMDYFRETNNQMMERKKWYETREFAQKKYLPQVLTYAQNVNTLDPQSRRMMLDDILDGYNKTIGQDYKIASIDGSNPFIVTLQGKKGAQVVDIRNLFNDDENAQTLLNMQMPEYLKKQQEQRQQQELKNKMGREELELKKYKEGLDTEMFGQKGDMTGQGIENNSININGKDYMAIPLSDQKASTAYRKDVTKASNQIPVNNQAIETIEKMEEIFNRKPDIGNSFLNVLDAGDENSWSNLIAKKFTNSEDLADIQKLKKLSSDLNLSTILGVPGKNATDLLKKTVKDASPHGKLTHEAFKSIADSWKKAAADRNDLIMAQMFGLTKGLQISSKAIAGNQPNSPNASGSNEFDFSDLGKLVQ